MSEQNKRLISVQTYSEQISFLFQNQQFEQALSHLQEALLIYPNNATLYLDKGVALAALNLHKEAIQAFDRAISLESTMFEAYFNQGRVFNKLGQPAKALQAFNAASQLAPQNAMRYQADIHRERGKILLALEDYATAILAYDTSLQFEPQSAVSYQGKGVALYSLARYQEAEAACNKALQLDPKFELAYHTRGSVLYAQGQPLAAQQNFMQALELNPHCAVAYTGLGHVLALCRSICSLSRGITVGATISHRTTKSKSGNSCTPATIYSALPTDSFYRSLSAAGIDLYSAR